MIIIGYQGIGKSTLAKNRLDIIDFESGWTKVEGKRDLNWGKTYAQMAEGLSRQGYIVFVASHFCVQEALLKSKEIVYAIFPALELKNEWVTKLHERWNSSGLEEDRLAYLDAYMSYEQEIKILMGNFPEKNAIILEKDYDLERMIEEIAKIYA